MAKLKKKTVPTKKQVSSKKTPVKKTVIKKPTDVSSIKRLKGDVVAVAIGM